mgnify:CR=1 FL=1
MSNTQLMFLRFIREIKGGREKLPIFWPGATYPDLTLKAPLGLKLVIPESNLHNAIAEIGQNGIASVKWGLKIWVCPPNNPTCNNPIEAGEVALVFNGVQFFLQVVIGQYYVTRPVVLQYNYQEDLSNISELILYIYFLGSARLLSSTSAYLDSSGKPVAGKNEYLTYYIELIPELYFGQIADSNLPEALKVPLIMVIPRSTKKNK